MADDETHIEFLLIRNQTTRQERDALAERIWQLAYSPQWPFEWPLNRVDVYGDATLNEGDATWAIVGPRNMERKEHTVYSQKYAKQLEEILSEPPETVNLTLPFELSFEDPSGKTYAKTFRVVLAEFPAGDPEALAIAGNLNKYLRPEFMEESFNKAFAWVSEMQQIHGEKK